MGYNFNRLFFSKAVVYTSDGNLMLTVIYVYFI